MEESDNSMNTPPTTPISPPSSIFVIESDSFDNEENQL